MDTVQAPSLNIACRLVIGAEHIRVGQICTGYLVLDADRDFPPCDAKLIVVVNGKRRVYRGYLPNGIVAGEEATTFF